MKWHCNARHSDVIVHEPGLYGVDTKRHCIDIVFAGINTAVCLDFLNTLPPLVLPLILTCPGLVWLLKFCQCR
jgi:hypothetical protein